MNPFVRVRTAWLLLAASMLGLVGCGGGSSSDGQAGSSPSPSTASCSGSTCGQVWIGMTDADGDFLSYTVDVMSIRLRRADGALVETLPAQTRVDFAQYVDLTEFMTAASVPLGT